MVSSVFIKLNAQECTAKFLLRMSLPQTCQCCARRHDVNSYLQYFMCNSYPCVYVLRCRLVQACALEHLYKALLCTLELTHRESLLVHTVWMSHEMQHRTEMTLLYGNSVAPDSLTYLFIYAGHTRLVHFFFYHQKHFAMIMMLNTC